MPIRSPPAPRMLRVEIGPDPATGSVDDQAADEGPRAPNRGETFGEKAGSHSRTPATTRGTYSDGNDDETSMSGLPTLLADRAARAQTEALNTPLAGPASDGRGATWPHVTGCPVVASGKRALRPCSPKRDGRGTEAEVCLACQLSAALGYARSARGRSGAPFSFTVAQTVQSFGNAWPIRPGPGAEKGSFVRLADGFLGPIFAFGLLEVFVPQADISTCLRYSA